MMKTSHETSLHAQVDKFIEIGRSIIFHPVYLRTRDFTHHDETVFEHTLMVAFEAFRFAEKYALDIESITRGAILHDFFLYDWHKEGRRVKKPLFKKHGFTHARIAYENAKFYFPVNKKEKDVILKHMFPLTLKPPMYIESWAVNVIDDYVTYREYFKDRKETHKLLFKKVYKTLKKEAR